MNKISLLLLLLLSACATDGPTVDTEAEHENGSSGPTVYGAVVL
ncbi:MAG: hypothetical protein U9Q81_04040 [Pseudomonadota bacterium]|nr:hypothetical protein [Pseudomonadota bacterium]